MPDRPVVSTETPEKSLVLDTQALFQGRKEIVIEHDGSHYRLRITRRGKLILTK